jgi:hypothetical protein
MKNRKTINPALGPATHCNACDEAIGDFQNKDVNDEQHTDI